MALVITFAQQKGGAGKTTLLVHLAHAWVLAGRKVAAIDLDPQRSLTRWLAPGKLPMITAVESREYAATTDIKQASRHHDFVLVDCPGNASHLLEAAIRASDLVLVPCQPSGLDIWATDAVLEMASRERTAGAVVMNRVPSRGSVTEMVVAKLRDTGANVLTSRLGNRVAFSAGQMSGTTALAKSTSSPAALEVQDLRREIEALLD